jgi:hypothetical protein
LSPQYSAQAVLLLQELEVASGRSHPAAKVFTHAARHEDEVTSRFESTRTDALFIISLTTAAIWELAAPGAVGEPFKTRDVAVARPN